MLLGGLKHTLLLGILCLFFIAGLPESARAGDDDIKGSAQSSRIEKKAQSSKQSDDKGKRKKVHASKKKRRARRSTRVNRFKRDEQRLEEVQLLSELEFVDPSLCVDEATPLHVAAASGDKDVILDLLLEGADIRAEDPWGQTPLMLATEAGHFDVCLFLMRQLRDSFGNEALADVICRVNIGGSSLLDLAVRARNSKMVHFLLSKIRKEVLVEMANGLIVVNNEINSGYLHVAAMHGSLEIVCLFLNRGGDVNLLDGMGRTPLHYAAMEGHADVVQTLLSRGALAGAVDEHQRTPLHFAIEMGHGQVAAVLREALVANGQDASGTLNAADKYKRTPLHYAAMEGNVDEVRELLNAGVAADVYDRWDRSPLHYAAMEGHADVVQTLLSRGALAGAVDEHQRTPLHFAIEMGHGQVAAVLREALVANGQDASGTLNAADKYKRTPLHYAAMEGNVDEVRELLNAGVAANVYDRWDRSPLHHAAWGGNLAIVQLLLTKVSEDVAFDLISAVDRNGQNPFHLAAQEGHEEVIASMIAMLHGEPLLRGVLSRKDNWGKTPAEYALDDEHRGIFKLLMQEIHRDSGNMFLSLFDDGASSSTSFGITRSPYFNWN